MRSIVVLIVIAAVLFFASATPAGAAPPPDPADGAAGCAACGGCGVFFIVVPLVILVLNIAMLIWVARDAKARSMDSSVIWMVLVMFTSVLGLGIYIFSRPQGSLVVCENCGNKRLQASRRCPHCGSA